MLYVTLSLLGTSTNLSDLSLTLMLVIRFPGIFPSGFAPSKLESYLTLIESDTCKKPPLAPNLGKPFLSMITLPSLSVA